MKIAIAIMLAAMLAGVGYLVSKAMKPAPAPPRVCPTPAEAYYVGLKHGWQVRDIGLPESDLEAMFFLVTSNDSRAFSNWFAAKVKVRE